jgi:hypothetical protein
MHEPLTRLYGAFWLLTLALLLLATLAGAR